MRTFSRYLLESPIDELPPTIKGEHPHKIHDTYREEMESAIRDENWPPQADIGFTTRSVYYDPDREVTSNISMDHATPGWAERRDGNHGVAHVVVSVSGKTNDKSKSKFHMPSEVMGIIDSSHRHLHHFIGENTPRGLHTIEYETKDPKRHALYQHMARLHPHITFKNISKLKSVKRKPKPVAVPESYTVNTNYWNTANINKFILESPLDELPAAVEGPHPHIVKDTYEDEKKRVAKRFKEDPTPYLGNVSHDRFLSTRVYHDPHSGVKTNITMVHRTPGSTIEMNTPWETVGVAQVKVSVNDEFDDVSSKSGSGFQMPGDIMKKISVASGHLHHFIGEHNPHTIEYDTSDPKRHALYQHMARLYPHIVFKNIYTRWGKEMKTIKRKLKPVAVPESYTVNTNYWNTANINKFILESPLDELPAAVEGQHPHETENDHFVNAREAAWNMKWDTKGTPITFDSHHAYHDPDTRITTGIRMTHTNPGWTGKPDKRAGVAHVHITLSGFTDPGFQMPGAVMEKIKSGIHHFDDFEKKYKPHTVEYDTTDPKRHALYQHMARLYPHIAFRNISELIPVKRKPKPVAIPESYTQKQMATANKTSRNSGAIGKKAITPAYVKTITGKKHKILDFGSGRDAAHTKSLRKTGRNVTAHEFGANVNKNHNPRALKKKYDTVFASNVLNTSSSRKMLSDTLDQMHSAVAPGGALVANLPLSPRKSVKVDAKHLMRQLLNRFGDVRRVGGTKKAPLFHASRPK